MSAPAAAAPRVEPPESSKRSLAEFASAVRANNYVNVSDYSDWTSSPLGQVVKDRLKSKVAIITGASAGIGAVTARRLAAEGAKVVLFARREEQLATVVNAIKKSGGDAAYFVGDAAKESDNKAVVEFALRTYGALHIAFNNAGISRGRNLKPWEVDGKLFEELMATNVNAIFYAVKHQAPAIGRSGGGVILNNGSGLALSTGLANTGIYLASKSWVVCYTKHTAADLAQIGVRINCISPGYTLSDIANDTRHGQQRLINLSLSMSVIGRVLKPEEIAASVAYLASDDAKAITGIDLIVDGGLSIAPRL